MSEPNPIPIMTPEEILAKLRDHYAKHKDVIRQMHVYSEEAQALGLEFHKKRLTETFPDGVFAERALVTTINARQTPTSLNTQLETLAKTELKDPLIIFNPMEYLFYVFTK